MDVLYHGSSVIVEKPEYGKGKPYNDYGRGFYCTRHIELAKEWAVGEKDDGYVNKYEIDLSKLEILNLLDEKYHILNWLALLLKNRDFNVHSPVSLQGKQFILDNYLLNTEEYDLIIGYRADDSYFAFARDFISNTISLDQLSYAMKLGELKEQYVLISKKAFDLIRFVSSELVKSEEYYQKRKTRDENARHAYFDQLNITDMNGIYLRDLINGTEI